MVRPVKNLTGLTSFAALTLVMSWAAVTGHADVVDESTDEFTLVSDKVDRELASFSHEPPFNEAENWHAGHHDRRIPWPSDQMSRTPDMFGDFHTEDRVALFTRTNPPADFVTADLPLSGGTRRVKVSEHNRALPTDRVYFIYQHFHGALRLERTSAAGQSYPIEKFTFGAEKTVLNGMWSIEVRMPFTTGHEVTDPAALTDFVLTGGEIGNASFILKHLLYVGPRLGVSAGIGLNTPTGSDVAGSLPRHDSPLSFEVRNEAYQALPFIGAVATDGDRVFGHVFLQVDAGLNGNQVSFSDSNGNSFSTRFNEQTLLYLDASYGRWLFHPPRPAGFFTGVAAMVELHYATSLAAPDEVPVFQFGQFQGSLFDDIVNVTAGINIELTGNSMLRFAGIFPFEGRPDRGFDAAWVASFVRRL